MECTAPGGALTAPQQAAVKGALATWLQQQLGITPVSVAMGSLGGTKYSAAATLPAGSSAADTARMANLLNTNDAVLTTLLTQAAGGVTVIVGRVSRCVM